MDDDIDTAPRLLASRGYHDPVATPHVLIREERVGAGADAAIAQVYRCLVTGAERRYGLREAGRPAIGERRAHA